MNKKDMYSNVNGPYISSGSDKVFENKPNYNSDLTTDFEAIHSSFAESTKSRKLYDRMDKLENEVKPSTTCLSGEFFSPYVRKDFTISPLNHFQELNDKFRALESKMFEVEKCFKAANQVDSEYVEGRLGDVSIIRSPSESVHKENASDITKEYRYRAAEGHRQFTEDYSNGNITKGWTGAHKSTIEERKLKNQMTTDGSGDMLQETSETTSLDSGKTMIKSLEKSQVQRLNRLGGNGLASVNQIVDEPQLEPSTPYIFNGNKKSADVDLLERSKQLILSLIDKELKKIEATSYNIITSNINEVSKMPDSHRNLKIECIQNIEKELKTLKKLESLEQ